MHDHYYVSTTREELLLKGHPVNTSFGAKEQGRDGKHKITASIKIACNITERKPMTIKTRENRKTS